MMQDEFQALQTENAALREENAMLRALVADWLPLKAQIETLHKQIQDLEQRVAKDSHNSHLPPSSDRFHRQPKSLRTSSGKKRGGQVGHQGQTLKQVSVPDAVVVHRVEYCERCQQDVRGVQSESMPRRQVIEVPPKRVEVTEHQVERKCCPVCGHVTGANFPEQVHAPVQYGAAYMGLAVYLVTQQLLPYQRACDLLFDLFGHPVSVGSLQQWVQHCSQQLEPVETQIKTALREAAVLHQDETGLYVSGQRQWMHVTSTPTLTHYAVHRKRGQEALQAIGILQDFHGVSVHDGWRSYWHFPCRHALCNVHLLRELTYLDEEHHQPWAHDLKTLLLDLKEAVSQAKDEGRSQLHLLEEQDWKGAYLGLLHEGQEAQTQEPEGRSPPDVAGKRGRRKHSPAQNLLTRLWQDQEAVLRFLDDFAVPFDNNLAERDVRMVKVQQKISGCFRSQQGAAAFARIRGYLSTLHKQGHALLLSLEQTLLGHPVLPSFQVPE